MARNRALNRIKPLFNIGKKIFDILDDVWSTLRGVLPLELVRALTPYILGGVGFISHLGEGVIGATRAYRVYKKKTIGQRKTQFWSSVLITMLAGSGMGLSISLMASTLGMAVSTATLLLAPALIPGLLMAIYSLSLWRKAYVFHKAKEKEAQTKQAYRDELLENEGCSLEERDARNIKRQAYWRFRGRRLRAERELAFNIVEVLASAMVVTSTILGTAAIIGASVGTFGALPFALLIAGVVAGVTCKILDHYDENHGFNFSIGLREWVRSFWCQRIKGEAPVSQPQPKKSSLHQKMVEQGMIEMRPLHRSEERPKPYVVPVNHPTPAPEMKSCEAPARVSGAELQSQPPSYLFTVNSGRMSGF